MACFLDFDCFEGGRGSGGFDLADDLEDGLDGGGGDDAVAEVEDVAGAVGGGGEDFG